MRIPLKGVLALAVWAAFAVAASADPGDLIPTVTVKAQKISARVVEHDGTDSNVEHYRYIDSKDDEITKLKATIESLNRDIADLKKMANRTTATLPAPVAAAPVMAGTVCTTGNCATTVRTGPLGGVKATTVCTGDQCFTVPATTTYASPAPVTYGGPAYYDVPVSYGYAAGGSCGSGFGASFGAGSCGGGFSVGYASGGWYPGKFIGRVFSGGCGG